ncbi:MAG: LysR family transcriptional regulator [Ruminococcus sp.]|nr:LysR family transcriptional regulator [Ruminococcus sp.]
MDINQLVYFISVAQTLNFSEAARRNYVSQSTVSRYIGDLEKELGVQLFTRTRREVFITNEGKTLLPYAIEMVSTFSKARNVIEELHDGGKGKITVACDVTSLRFPSQCLADFGKRYPGIRIELRRLDASDRSQAITGGEYDFCFMPRDMVPESSGIETMITHREPLVIVAPKRNRFKGKTLSFSQIAGERLVLLSEASAPILFMEVMDLLRTFHISPRVDSSYDDLASLYMAVSAGMGMTVLPKSLTEFASSSQTAYFSVEDADTSVAYVMAWAKDIANPVASLFTDTVRRYAEGEDNIYDL